MMSNAVIEFAIAFKTFTNVDLLSQGVYRLRASVRSKDGLALLSSPGGGDYSGTVITVKPIKQSKKSKSKGEPPRPNLIQGGTRLRMRAGSSRTTSVVATPYAVFPHKSACESKVRGRPVENSLQLYQPPACDDAWFCTRTMLVRYVDEVVTMTDGAHFRIVRPFGKNEDEQLYVVFTLDKAEFDDADPQNMRIVTNFSTICGRKFCINRPAGGVNEYVPIYFDDPTKAGFCVAECTIHAAIMELKYCPSITAPKTSKKKKKKKKEMNGKTKLQADANFANFLFGKAVKVVEGKNIEAHGELGSLYVKKQMSSSISSGSSNGSEATARTVASASSHMRRSSSSSPCPPNLLLDPLHRPIEDAAMRGMVNRIRLGYISPLIQAYRSVAECAALAVDEMRHAGIDVDDFPDVLSNIPEVKVPSHFPGTGEDDDAASVAQHRPSARDLAEMLQKEVHDLSSQIFPLWHSLLQILPFCPQRFTLELKRRWRQRCKTLSGENIVRERVEASNLFTSSDPSLSQTHAKVAESLRFCRMQHSLIDPSTIEDEYLFVDPKALPVIFEETYSIETSDRSAEPSAEKQPETETGIPDADLIIPSPYLDSDMRIPHPSELKNPCHSRRIKSFEEPVLTPLDVVVFVHGYMGSSWDLRLFRNIMATMHPSVRYLLSKSNERDTNADIADLGRNLAREVAMFITRVCISNRQPRVLRRLTFVAHSIGAVITRAALSHKLMLPYIDKLHTFVSFGAPHLGTVFNSQSFLVPTGMWLMKRFKKIDSLEQLSMSDHRDPRQCFLYKLSVDSNPYMRKFKHILIVSGSQDNYVPFHSARIQVPRRAENAAGSGSTLSGKNAAVAEMAKNILNGVDPDRVRRIDFSFNFRESRRRLDKFLGRAAHIQILDSAALVWLFIFQYDELFV